MFVPENKQDEEVVKKLSELGIKTRIKKFFKNDGHKDFLRKYYLLENYKYIYVLFDMGEIRSIVRQKNVRSGFTVSINGQAGQNAEQIYYA